MKRKLSDVLFATDMDDTLLDSKKQISVQNQEEIASFQAEGGKFVIATGRAVPATKPYVEELNIQSPCILYNGAAIYDFSAEQFLWTASLTPKAREYLREIMDSFPEVGAEILKDSRIYVIRKNKYVSWHVDVEHLEYDEVSADELGDGWFKILFVMAPEIQEKVWAFMMSRQYDDVYFVKSSEIYLEMMPAGVSKGDTLLRLADLLGIDRKNTVGIGDYNNDMELIQNAALGFAVANAPAEIRHIADRVAKDCNHSAVADALCYVREHLDSF